MSLEQTRNDVNANVKHTKIVLPDDPQTKHHYMFIRLVKDATEVAGGIDAIDSFDVNAYVDTDAEGNIIGVNLDWREKGALNDV